MKLGAVVTFGLLLTVKGLSRLLFRMRPHWLGNPPEDHWSDVRIGVLLNHTSLFEPVFAGLLPVRVLWTLSTKGAIPIADVTMQRPVAGFFFKRLAAQVITVSRKRDTTWKDMLKAVRPDSLIIIMPEGRMKRLDGLDKHGNRMTVRGGIADIIRAIPEGRMLIGYSGGLHHIQAPGQRFPRLFKKIRMNFESIDIAPYREAMLSEHGDKKFKRAVVRDLERRRDENCPPQE